MSLILLQQEVEMFLVNMDWLKVFDGVLQILDKFCKLAPEIESADADDMAWPGVMLGNLNMIM